MDTKEKQYDGLINKLLIVIESIDSLYNELYRLEKAGKKDSEQYSQYIKQLKKYIEEENKIYQNAHLSASEANDLADYIIEEKLPEDFTNDTESIATRNYNNKHLRRIVSYLVHIVMYDYQHVGKLIPESLLDTLTTTSISEPDKLVSSSIMASIELQSTLEEDNNNAFMFFLQKGIDETTKLDIRDDLLQCKYYSIFINKKLEEQLLANNLQIPNNLTSNADRVSSPDLMDSYSYLSIKESYGVKEVGHQISELIEITDFDYHDQAQKVNLVIRQCFLRAGLLFLRSKTIDKIKDQLKIFLNSKQFSERNPHHQIGEDAVFNSLINAENDKFIVQANSINKKRLS